MKEAEGRFLLAEFAQCWTLIVGIDERRAKFLQTITTVVIAAVGAVGFLIGQDKGALPLHRAVEATALLSFTLVGCLVMLRILLAEREANIRYRKKANVLRHLLLADAPSPSVLDYLSNHKELGVLIPGDKGEPVGVGSTLLWILVLLAAELLGILATVWYVWMRHAGWLSR